MSDLSHGPVTGPQGPHAYPSLTGRSVIVTGGGQGIGRCLVLALLERGANVTTIVARERETLAATLAEAEALPGEVLGLVADIRSPDDCQRVVQSTLDRFGAVHGLVNNAARGIDYVRQTTGGAPVPFWETDGSRWAEAIATNVTGTFQMSAAAAPHMVAQRFGRIVNVSTSDRSMVRAMNTPYGPSKAALESMSVAWSRELLSHDVTVNVLLPGGATRTRMATGVTGKPLYPPDIMNPAILWLCSDDSSGRTGGRYIATEWNPDIDPDEAAAGARQVSRDLPVIM